MYEEIKKYLEKSLSARERKNKNKFIAWFLIHKLILEISEELLEDIIVRANNYDRTWRKILQDNEHLRGKDYNDLVKLEQEKQIELGYEPNYRENVKKLQTL